MGEADKDEDIIVRIVSWYANIFKKEIAASKDKNIKLDMMDISKLVCSDVEIGEIRPEDIYIKLKDILLNKGIDVSIDECGNGEKFIILRLLKIPIINGSMPAKVTKISGDKKKNFFDILKDNKLYDKDTKNLLCPNCLLYSVKYSTSSYKEYDKIWRCDNCFVVVNYRSYDVVLDDKDKYQIYKLWGVDAIRILTNESMKNTKRFIASYFKNSCITKKDKCLYFDFFKD